MLFLNARGSAQEKTKLRVNDSPQVMQRIWISRTDNSIHFKLFVGLMQGMSRLIQETSLKVVWSWFASGLPNLYYT